MTFDMDQLNDEQMKPVLDTEGAVLVTAGAGSGKTRLLTHRIAHLIRDKGVKPYNILAITFTNKAAGEMRDRLYSMLGDEADDLWVFTFHALCVRILRKFIKKLGGRYTSSFSIYGEQEKERLVKRILKDLGEESDLAAAVIAGISSAKNAGISPDEYRKINSWMENIDVVSRAYFEYEKETEKSNALDYDDLLVKAYALLTRDEEARLYYQEKFRYIHVDEFQDTNKVQYQIVRILGAKHGNVFAVGDEDQSIYGWRGANFANIFDFTTDYPCKVYKLERNYRSTKKILELANRIIANNTTRLDKKLWTENASGEDVTYYAARSDGDEADYVLRKIMQLRRERGYKLSDFAVLMRINALSRSFEERMPTYGLSYMVYGGFKFYDRKEVKDVLAYLKILSNPGDEESILRVINFPKRGIGDSTVEQLRNYSAVTGVRLYDVIFDLETNEDLPRALIKKVMPFTNVLRCMRSAYEAGGSLFELVKYIIRVTGMRECYEEDTDDNAARKENIRELAHGVEQFEHDNPGGGLDEYLQQISLYSDTDEMTDELDCVSLATIHSAKGLEFKVVFVVGLEKGIFPSSRTENDEAGMEEERRLMYVAITRARERLFLTSARSRFRFGARQDCLPSVFLVEGGFITEDDARESDRESAYSYYSGRYDSYRGSRAYADNGPGRNREEVPAYQSATKPSRPSAPGIDLSLYAPGTKVRHPKYGEGRIVRLDTKGEPYAEVDFPGLGKLLLMLAYAHLEVVK